MQKYVAKQLYDHRTGEVVLPLRDVYLAPEVDARIAEMEKILRLCFFNIYPTGTTFEDAYADALKASNELMER